MFVLAIVLGLWVLAVGCGCLAGFGFLGLVVVFIVLLVVVYVAELLLFAVCSVTLGGWSGVGLFFMV